MVGKGFAKYLRRSPLSDDEIVSALTWIQGEIAAILNGSDSLPIPDMPATVVVPVAAGHGDSLPFLAELQPFTVADQTLHGDDDLPGMWESADFTGGAENIA